MKKHYYDYIYKIYDKIFCAINDQYIIVFLCGGASTKHKKSLRDKIRPLLEQNKLASIKFSIKVFYPEDLLIDFFNKTKKADLLSYEVFLANNSHIIVIICESAGSLVELGCFTNNSHTVNKVIAAVDKKRVKDKSFIMLGPIKFLKKIQKLNVVEYTCDEVKFANSLMKNIREKYSNDNFQKQIKLDTIIGMHYFIQLLLYFFKKLGSLEISTILRDILKKEGIELIEMEFNLMFSASLKLLFCDNKIFKVKGGLYSTYELTQFGYNSIKEIIMRCTSHKECDMIRMGIMYCDLYK